MKRRGLIKKGMETFLKLIALMSLLILMLQATARAEDGELIDKTQNMVRKTEVITSFDWIQDVDPSIGSISIQDDGRTVNMTGNGTLAGKNAIYIIPESHQEQTLTFDYSVDYGDSFNAAGILLRIREQDGYLEGYLLSFNNPGGSSDWYSGSGNQLGAIWKIRYQLKTNTSDYVEKTLVKALNIPQSGKITVQSTQDQIILTGDNINETIETSGNTAKGDGFGFFTDHYSHNCSEIGHFALTSFGLQTVDLIPHNFIVDPNGGIWNGTGEVSEIEGIYQNTVDVPVPTRDGYTFVKWTQIGDSGTMSSLTEDAIYTFGENEEIDDKIVAEWIRIVGSKTSNVTAGEVKAGDVVTYTITLKNEGTVDGKAVINDDVPTGTTFMENSIKINGAESQYTLEDLKNGIEVDVPTGGETTLAFDVQVNDLNDEDLISNKANYRDITVEGKETDGETNQVDLTYVEPVISVSKDLTTENNNDYVVTGETIEYQIVVQNAGGLEKDVIIKDAIPEGTTFVDGSIKINDEETNYTQEDLENGIQINVPKKIKDTDINTDSISNMLRLMSMKALEKNSLPGEVVLTFEVTVNEQDDETAIKNIAQVDDMQTNEVDTIFRKPIISAEKEIQTENGLDYVVTNENIEYSIVVENAGSISKDVVVQDSVPEGTTFVDGSIKVNGEETDYTEKDLEDGITIEVPEKQIKEDSILQREPGKTVLTFEVTANNQKDENKIINIAKVDDVETNEVESTYRKPIISAKKEMQTENGLDYVVSNENIEYSIVVENSGSISKDVIVQDLIPEGTTFVDGSIKVDGKETDYTQADLKEGIEIEVPGKHLKGESGDKENQDEDKVEDSENQDTTDDKETPEQSGNIEDVEEPSNTETEEGETIEESNDMQTEEQLDNQKKEEIVGVLIDNNEINNSKVTATNDNLENSNTNANEENTTNVNGTDSDEENVVDDNTTKEDPDEDVKPDEDSNLQENEEPGKIVLTFEVTVDELTTDDETMMIENTAQVDSKDTNKTSIEALPFNMKIDEEITGFIANGVTKTSGDPKLAKTDIDMRKRSPTPDVTANIKVTVTNTGKIAGSATVEATIPEGFSLASSNWQLTGANTVRTETKEIAPGESEEISLDVKWNNSETNLGEKNTKAQIVGVSNEAKAGETTTEDNESDAKMIIGIVTGEYDNVIIISFIVVITLIAISGEIVLIKKFVL